MILEVEYGELKRKTLWIHRIQPTAWYISHLHTHTCTCAPTHMHAHTHIWETQLCFGQDYWKMCMHLCLMWTRSCPLSFSILAPRSYNVVQSPAPFRSSVPLTVVAGALGKFHYARIILQRPCLKQRLDFLMFLYRYLNIHGFPQFWSRGTN